MQEVIVYRNPAEAAFWGAIMSPTTPFIVIAVVVFFAVLLSLDSLMRNSKNKTIRGWGNTSAPLVIAAGAAFGVLFYFLK